MGGVSFGVYRLGVSLSYFNLVGLIAENNT